MHINTYHIRAQTLSEVVGIVRDTHSMEAHAEYPVIS